MLQTAANWTLSTVNQDNKKSKDQNVNHFHIFLGLSHYRRFLPQDIFKCAVKVTL